MQQVLLSLVAYLLGTAVVKALIVALTWLVLDAIATAGSEALQGRFAPEAFSFFLEKVGGEFVGLVVLGIGALLPIQVQVQPGIYVNPLLGLFLLGIAAFTTTEMSGALAKVQDFVAYIQARKAQSQLPTGPQAPSAPQS